MRMDQRTNVSSQMHDLAKRPISVSYEIAEQLSKGKQCKVIAARAMAARAILKAASDGMGANAALETILERTEGKVGSPDGQGGNTINFIFNSFGNQQAIPGSAGEVIQGVLASQRVNPLPSGDTPLTRPVETRAQRAITANTLDDVSSEDEYMPGAD